MVVEPCTAEPIVYESEIDAIAAKLLRRRMDKIRRSIGRGEMSQHAPRARRAHRTVGGSITKWDSGSPEDVTWGSFNERGPQLALGAHGTEVSRAQQGAAKKASNGDWDPQKHFEVHENEDGSMARGMEALIQSNADRCDLLLPEQGTHLDRDIGDIQGGIISI
uniref:Uncharacterized protein n=1 Tax=Pyrodinium bahamense TaxID=73915 RepID=A0A7S0AXN3_9DINO|mmetsp:Transcript_43915/g.122140  ORF Transcript_43915/g.122140 Transcript_43915/m.122140 type:complete len:164 (+) Transcript_43915:66-557(+)